MENVKSSRDLLDRLVVENKGKAFLSIVAIELC